MIETVELPEMTAIGVLVEAHWNDLPKAIPVAWTRLFETDTGASSFLEVSMSREGGIYRELVGYLAAKKTEVPDGMVRLVIPAQRYLRIIHDGPLVEIAAGFEKLYAHAAVAGLKATDYKLVFGYLPGLAAGRHELHVALEPEPLRLG
ncbi:MAG TPA: effector binding domain-containing protein [Devosia sp.]|jgi:predicted transcriptional regulator YdeE|uniref:GyrI-like domain-containing protein n=1 Tax=Devosia sp. TaxID=1871048 RepID=UPI002DDCF32D|nr:effector binding domain-containing protein [Devosia sp.]HEV2513680.1 effector binding domain-containing protein [Devosia sp.]